MGEAKDPYYEEDGIVSGQIRDFTRRYGMISPSEFSGIMTDQAGRLWEPIDHSSVESILFGGMRRVNREDISPHHPPADPELGGPLPTYQ